MGTVKVHSQQTNTMNALIILAVLGYACGLPQHQVFMADTPDVAAAKARHFQAHSARNAITRTASPQQATFVVQQQPRWTGPMAHTVPAGVNVHHAAVNAFHVPAAVRTQKWTGPVAATIPAGVQGLNQAAPVHQAWQPAAQVQPRWTGPMAATIPAGVHGAPAQVAQTADVAAATQAHFAAHQHALRATMG